jgi:hypothetical protein
VRWTPLAEVETFLRREGVQDGELVIPADFAFPLWQSLDRRPAGRYYFLHNNLLAFRSRRPAIWADTISDRTRFVVLDIRVMRRDYYRHDDDSPLPADWDSWKNRVALRAGPYVVVRVNADELRRLLAETTDLD